MFYEIKLETWKKNFCKNVRVKNSKSDAILRDSI